MSDSFGISRQETLLTSHIFAVERRTVSHHDGDFTRDIVIHPGAVAIVVVDDHDRVGLLRQYRSSVDRVLWEIPAGTIDAADCDARATAERELLEEVGVHAATWSKIVDVYVSPGWTNQIMHVFLASELTEEHRSPDGPEERAAEVVWLTREQVREMLDSDEISDATLYIGLRHFLEVDDVP